MDRNEIEIKRCNWCKDDALLIAYHDKEWGRFPNSDFQLFEALTLEIFQAGLSWRTILHKRDNFRKAFESFQFDKIAEYSERDVEKLLMNAGIVRNRRKIEATIYNASICIDLVNHFGSFSLFLKSLPSSELEQQKLIKRTFKHVGLTTAESFLMAIGIIEPTHSQDCFLSK